MRTLIPLSLCIALATAAAASPAVPDSAGRVQAAGQADSAGLEAAEQSCRKALENDPASAENHYNLGRVLALRRKPDAAAECFGRAIELNSSYADAYFSLAGIEEQRGRWDVSLARWLDGLRSRPDFVPALKRAAWIMATASTESLRDGSRAVALAGEAVRLTGSGDTEALDVLAAAYAEAGRFKEAAATALKAIQAAGDTQAVPILQRLRRYEAGKPWRDTLIRR